MSLQRCQRETTSTEFLEWQRFLDQDIRETDPRDLYLAQIACEVRRSYIEKPNAVKPDDFLLKFKGEDEKPKPLTEEQKKAHMEASKAKWMGITGIKGQKPPPQGNANGQR